MTNTKILKSGWIKITPPRKDMDKMTLDKIKVNDSRSYPDSTCIERVLFYFQECDSAGAISCSDNRFLVVMEVETGYRPKTSVDADLRKLLSRFEIIKIEEVVQAFRYRHFYLNI